MANRIPFVARLVLVAVGLVAAMSAATAHNLGFTRTVAVLLPDGGYRIDMQVDLDALALGASSQTDSAELVAALEAMSPAELAETTERLRRSFVRRVRLRCDGAVVIPEVRFPDSGSERARAAGTMLGLTARLTGTLPPGATGLSVAASRTFPPLHITWVDLRGRTVDPERLDELLRFEPPPSGADGSADVAGRLGDLVTLREILEPGARSDPYPLDHPPPPPRRTEVVREYVGLGFQHILPLGLDHILFVFGLFLLSSAWRPLLAQVTAFTAAHTLTLALSTYGVVSLSPRIVEPLIALSIAWIAFENVFTRKLHWWRPVVVFGFGLLHGLGFAGVLSRLGLPRGEYLTALLSFNAGVELGQLAVLALAFASIGLFRRRPWYRPRMTVPLSVAIGLIGLYWAIQRAFFWG